MCSRLLKLVQFEKALADVKVCQTFGLSVIIFRVVETFAEMLYGLLLPILGHFEQLEP